MEPVMLRWSVPAAVLLAVAHASGAHAQEKPSFDCRTARPSYASCGLTLHAPLTNGRLSDDPAFGEGACRFDLTTGPGRIDIARRGCDAFRGNGASITGTDRCLR